MTRSLSLTKVAAFKQELRSLMEQLKAEVSEEMHQQLTGHTHTTDVHDRGEEAETSVEIMLNVEMLAKHSDELAECYKALQRIESGDFGFCIDCEEEIELSRLSANPSASRCIRCQSVFESALSKSA